MLVVFSVFSINYFYSTGNVISEDNVTVQKESIIYNYESFCKSYDEDDEFYEEYDGYCEVFFGDVVVFSGLSVGIEYVSKKGSSISVNGERSYLLSEGDFQYFDNLVDEKVKIFLDGILFSENGKYRDGVIFKYDNEKVIPRSFCTGVVCTLYKNDNILIDIHDIRLEEFCFNDEDCDFEVKVNGEYYEVEGSAEGDIIRVENLTWGIMKLDTYRGFMKFNHSYRIDDNFCFDSDSGMNYSSFGNVSGFYSTENYTYGEGPVAPYVVTDYCYEFEPYLIEFYCGEDNFIDAEVVVCDSCVDGACVMGNRTVRQSENQTTENLSDVDYKNFNEEVVRNYPKSEKKKKFWLDRFFAWLF
jgi:hypothetical protein